MRILGHFSFIYVYMTTCLQLLSTKMQFWVSAPFLLEYCSPVRTKRVSTSDKTQSALKTSFSLITSSLPIYHYRYRASRMGANWQHINMTTNTREKIRTRRRRRKRPTDRPRTLFRECEVFSNTSYLSHLVLLPNLRPLSLKIPKTKALTGYQ